MTNYVKKIELSIKKIRGNYWQYLLHYISLNLFILQQGKLINWFYYIYYKSIYYKSEVIHILGI